MKSAKLLTSRSRSAASPIFLVLFASATAQADLVTSDDFNYADNTALQAVWGANASQTGGLTFSSLATSGSAVQTTGTDTPVQIQKPIGTGIANGGSMWTSYLVRLDSDPAGHGYGGSGNELRNFLQPFGSSNLNFTTSPMIAPAWNGQTNFFTDFGNHYGTAGSPVMEISKGTPYLVISYVDKVGIGAYQGDQYQTAWIFTASGFDALVAAGVTQANLDTYAASQATAVATEWGDAAVAATDSSVFLNKDGTATFDEYRLGTTLADVTPLASVPAGYDSWINSLAYNTPTPLTPAQKDPNADPDSDGISNLMEFVLGGNPVIGSQAILPVVTLDTSNITLKFNRSDLSESTTSLQVEISEDLGDWITIPPIPVGAVSSAGVTIDENGSADDSITVVIPRNGSLKKFARLVAVKVP